jgi:hypothetical protein
MYLIGRDGLRLVPEKTKKAKQHADLRIDLSFRDLRQALLPAYLNLTPPAESSKIRRF